MSLQLLQKYNVAGPRYTSYPTVPYWDTEAPNQTQWANHVKQQFVASNKKEGISLYIHLPFCESLCTYCGCNTRITVNHAVEKPYIDALLKEWKMYFSLFNEKPNIAEIHLGGGTPTFFQPENLQLLLSQIINDCTILPTAELSFEGHPNNTTAEHLQVLYNLGFRRVSFGIQDFDDKVQQIINRVQPYKNVKHVVEKAREIGYTSINFDLVYGLPLQTQQSIQQTVEMVCELNPDRIAFYSYAHVPWIKPGQRKYTEKDLPVGEEKRKLYELGLSLFEKNNFVEVGMDHFAKTDDALYVAMQNKKLHRNFMGYTTATSKLMIGLGVSSISDSWTAFAQNTKVVEEYYKMVDEGNFPLIKNHFLTKEDEVIRKHILKIMCNYSTSWNCLCEQTPALFDALPRLNEMENDGLITISNNTLNVTEAGKPFIRNVCMAFDARLWRNVPKTQLFSSVV
ncbi:MAG: oxygen-independent coproporphyrinogen III oxidase [Bacteroidota bacterium]